METKLKSLVLENKHIELGGKMVPFAGYLMPIQYTSVIEEHMAVRNRVGVVDVSHMGEFILKGQRAVELIQLVSSNDVSTLKVGDAQYSCLPNQDGGIVDDLLIYRLGEEEYMLVVNASNIEKDWNWINSQNTFGVEIENYSDKISLFSVTGPLATNVLQKMTDEDLSAIKYYTFKVANIAVFDEIYEIIISATGYTGAGGFELYVPNKQASKLWNAIFEAGEEEDILAVGLGARDTLRLEMGYCLYGNDIDDTTSPIEAGLGWVTKFNKPFINSEWLQNQKKNGVNRKLIGFEMEEKGIPRQGYLIYDEQGDTIGKVTSGSQSPVLKKGIGLGYVAIESSKPQTDVWIEIRNKRVKAQIKKVPFI